MRICCSVCLFIVVVCLFNQVTFAEEIEALPEKHVEITTEMLPFGCAGDEYSTQIYATGGSGEYFFSAELLPSGLSLDESGELSGKLKVKAGKYSFVVYTADKFNKLWKHQKKLTITVFEELLFSNDSIAPAVNGSEYTLNIGAVGGSGKYIFNARGLPKGLSIDEAGVVSGIPDDEPGKTLVEFTVSDTAFSEKKYSKDFTFTLFQPVKIITEFFPVLLKRQHYKTLIEAEGGSGKYSFSATGLPSVLNLSESGKLTGQIDLIRGTYNFTIKVKDEKAPSEVEKQMTLTVVDFFPDEYEAEKDNDFTSSNKVLPDDPEQKHSFDQPGDRDIIKLDLRNVQARDVIRVKTAASGTASKPTLKLHSFDGSTIESINATGKDGYAGFLYVCNNPGIYYVSVEEASGETGEYSISTINQGQRVKIETKEFPDILKKSNASMSIEAVHGSGTYLFSADNLPSGLNLSDKGTISGFVNAPAGIYPFVVTAADAIWKGVFVERSYNLKIVDFFPDSFEDLEDNDINTRNTLTPGNTARRHTFNYTGDVDYTVLDLSGTSPGNIIDIQTHKLTEATNTGITLFAPDKKQEVSGFEIGKSTYSRFVFECESPESYLLRVEESTMSIGDYSLLLVDTGPKVKFKTEIIPDVLSKGKSGFQVKAMDGSGHYRFSANKLPGKLAVNDSGLLTINDNIGLVAGQYPFKLRVDDTDYPGIFAEQEFTLVVVDFFPDEYEKAGDNGFQTTNILKPGDDLQEHTFNYEGDDDYIILDLRDIAAGNVIHMKTSQWTQPTQTVLTLFDSKQNILISDKEKDKELYSELYFKNPAPGIYTLKVEEKTKHTGDYRLTVNDMGPAVKIITEVIPDALINSGYQVKFDAADGSGKYIFKSTGLPEELSMDKSGLISGKTIVPSGSYPLKITVDDVEYTGVSDQKDMVLKVVDFFPDDYEAAGDDDFGTANTMIPDGSIQEHTFNTEGDPDYVKLDLSACSPGDVIKIESLMFTRKTEVTLDLYDSDQNETGAVSETGKDEYPKIIFHCKSPGIYYLKAYEKSNKVGDYQLKSINTGPHLQIAATSIYDVLKASNYNTILKITGGSGRFTVKTLNLPEGLGMDNKGVISGLTNVEGYIVYTFNVAAFDAVHPENCIKKDITVMIVDYYPDSFEPMKDNSLLTTNTMAPGEKQSHNFNFPGDEDFIKLDLSSAAKGDVIVLESTRLEKNTDTTFVLYNGKKEEIEKDDNSGKEGYAKLVFSCKNPGFYYLKAASKEKTTGDYIVKLGNSGQPLKFSTPETPIAESVESYNTPIATSGGCGKYKFSVSEGTLPKGLKLGPKSGIIKGKNKNWGDFKFAVTAKDKKFPENNVTKEYQIDAYIGKKLSGTASIVYPFYVTSTFSADDSYNSITALPGRIVGGIKKNLIYKIAEHNVPAERFEHTFNPKTAELILKELAPATCDQYRSFTIEVEIEVKDRINTNNTMIFKYKIPAKCLTY